MKFSTQHRTFSGLDRRGKPIKRALHRNKETVWATDEKMLTVFSEVMPTVRKAKEWMKRPFFERT